MEESKHKSLCMSLWLCHLEKFPEHCEKKKVNRPGSFSELLVGAEYEWECNDTIRDQG